VVPSHLLDASLFNFAGLESRQDTRRIEVRHIEAAMPRVTTDGATGDH
jgi:hypothetical protein